MKNFRKKTFKKMFALTMAFSIMLISCTSNSTDSTPITNSEANLTGKNFFNAIYFKRGPLVDKIYKNELSVFTKGKITADMNMAEVNSFQDKILNEIIKNNQGFMNEFEKSIKSNDIKAIESIVNKGAGLVFKTLSLLKDDSSLKDNKTFQKLVKDPHLEPKNDAGKQACILYLAVYFAIFYYQAIYTETLCERITSDQSDTNQLYKEKLVYNIYELQQK